MTVLQHWYYLFNLPYYSLVDKFMNIPGKIYMPLQKVL